MNWLIVLKMMFYASTLEIFIVCGLALISVLDAAPAACLPPLASVEVVFPVVFYVFFVFLESVVPYLALSGSFGLLSPRLADEPKKLPLNFPPILENPIVDKRPPAA